MKLDQATFDRCLDSGAETAAVTRGMDEGKRLGLTGTPTFFVNGHFLSGAVDYNTLNELVEQQLLQASPTATGRLALGR